MMARLQRLARLAAVAAAVVVVPGGAARADVAPGTVINKANADQVKDLVSPGVMWCFQHGLAMKVIPYKKIEWNPTVQGGHREVLGPGQAVPRRPLDRGPRRRAAVPEHRPERPERGAQDHVQLRVQAVHHRRLRPAQLRRRHRHGLGEPARRSSGTSSSITCARSSTPRASTSIRSRSAAQQRGRARQAVAAPDPRAVRPERRRR